MDKIWKSKIIFQPLKKKKPQFILPNEISNKIIELQMQIDDGQINKDKIVQLLQQYTKAIQFFQEHNDQRYKLYKKKMQKFLQKPSITIILKNGKSKMAIKKQKNQEQLRKASTQNKIVMKKIIKCSQEGIQKQKQYIKQQISQQNQKLQERLQRKKIKSQIKSKISASFSTSTAKEDQELLLMEFQQIKFPNKKIYF